MRTKGENQGKRETQKQVLTSNQICCIDFATLALEQIRETATLPSGKHCSLERGGSGGAPHLPQTGGRDAHTRAALGMRAPPERRSGGMRGMRRVREALITEAAGATRSPFPAR